MRSKLTLSKPGRLGGANGLDGPGGRMNPPQPLQLLVVEGLDAEAQPGHARLAECGEPRGRGGFGIGLEGDLGVLGDGVGLPAGGDEPRDLRRIEERRRAAAEEDRVSGPPVRGFADFALERDDVPASSARHRAGPIEIAVAADRLAKGMWR